MDKSPFYSLTNLKKLSLANCCGIRGMKRWNALLLENNQLLGGVTLPCHVYSLKGCQLSTIDCKEFFFPFSFLSFFFYQKLPKCTGLIFFSKTILLFHIYLHISIHWSATANPDWAILFQETQTQADTAVCIQSLPRSISLG